MANTTAGPGEPAKLQLKIGTVEQAPFLDHKATANGETFTGFIPDLIGAIAEKIGFEYEFVMAPKNAIGNLMDNGWNGLMREVVDKKVDVGAGPITITPQREEYVDFTSPFMSNSVNLLVKKPSWFDLGLGYLARPFSSDYWIMVLVVLLLIGIVFFIIGKFSPYEWGNVAADRDPRGSKNSFTLRNSYLFVLSTLTWQGFRETPKSLSGRIMAAFWWMFILFTLVAYTANLTAYLLARPEQTPEFKFKTYEELLENPDITVGAVNFGATQQMLRTSRSNTLRALWTKMANLNSWQNNYADGVKRVEESNGNFVFFMDSASSEYYARLNCDLMMYGESIFPSAFAFTVQTGSALRQEFSDAITQLKNDGYIDQLKAKYWAHIGNCRNVDGRMYSAKGLTSLPIYPITLKDMAVAILLLFLGFIAAIICLLIEVVYYAVTKKGKKIQKPKILNAKIFKPKSKAAKAAPTNIEEEEAGPSSDGLESVPLHETDDQPASAPSDEVHVEEETGKAVEA